MIDCKKYSSLEKLLRVTCFVRRFILNLEAKVRGEKLLEGELSTLEMENSEVLWLKYEQQFLVNGETFGKIKHSLNLFYDEQSLLHSKTRHCELDKLDINRKLPILLRSYSHFTKLVIMDSYEKVFHSDINSTLNFLRNKYWLIRGRQSIKSLLKNCVTCKNINEKAVIPPKTPSLPKSRVDYSYPYQNIGLDYAGPIYYKSADNSKRKMSKGYFLIITCCCTRAVHVEFTPDLSIKSFLLAFRRFISGCGVPENIISDNFKAFKSKEVRNFMRYLRVKWNFILEKSPWWGGFYE